MPPIAFGEVSGSDDFHILHCFHGHPIKYFSGTPEYSHFFQNGLVAFTEENYFEAFSSMYFTLEQFRSTFVKLCLLIDFQLKYDQIEEFTKPFSKSSVQTEGAFNALYSGRFKKAPPKVSSSLVKLRNDIMHGSVNTQKKDVEKCAINIYNFIKPIEIALFFEDHNGNNMSFLQYYSNMKFDSLSKKGILTHEDLNSGKSTILTDTANVLGKIPMIDDPIPSEMYSFEQMINEAKTKKQIVENNMKLLKSIKEKIK